MNLDAAALTSDAVVLASVALVLRALASLVTRLGESTPKLVDAVSAAMKKRAEARRLAAAAQRIEATAGAAALERESAARAELEGRVRGLQHRLSDVADAMAEQARLATAEIEEAHRTTATAMGALEQLREDAAVERLRCDRAIAAIRAEMDERIREITSGHTPARRS